MRKISLTLILAAAVLLGVFHALGTYFYIYWREPGFDWIVHLLGGFFVTLSSLGIVYRISQNSNRALTVALGLALALVVGLAWEVFEVDIGAAIVSLRGYWSNTVGDILFDIIGGCLAIAYAYVPKKS